ncbi:MAG: outer membrane beta-barrel protein [Candidatus Marinimicrobia bacterium]|nr:outer membrane beta-barrel protein [Candidatus Neomarinimicrobiota bacterium]
MKKLMTLLLIVGLMGMLTVSYGQTSYSTSRASGTIMISGTGSYQTDLSQDLRSSYWNINTDLALFLFPQFAAGLDLGYGKHMQEMNDEEDPDVEETVVMSLGPRVYFFMGGKNSELTPFIKGGANYLINKTLYNDEEDERDESELGLVASAGLLLNLAKNVGLTVEAEYNFEKGTDVNDIDTKQLLVKFGIRSFLGE